ncbi:MAG TPA: ATP-binding cassette domain-containing protein [Actinomycetota bacterium]|nr:ATP-binding cassette domain-containing protein [Actinomycetota bacterium]
MRSDGRAAWCESVVKTYRTATSEVRALRGVSTEFPRGALTAVVGPSGSGKSSLLRLLCGLDRPNAGSVFVEGLAVHRASGRTLRALRRTGVGYVFQRPSDNFLPYLTVEEHLERAGRAGDDRIDAGEVIDRLGIGHRLGHLPGELSGGEQQRAAIAQVLVGGAGVVVADEPTAELDETSGRALLDTIAGLEVVTFVLATHDPTVWRHADDIVELDHGRIRPRRLRGTAPGEAPLEPDGDLPEPSAPPLVEVRGVSKWYRRGDEVVHAVEDVDLQVHQGEVTALVGRSGSGKTTLLNLLGAWEEPDHGGIEWAAPPSAWPPTWSDVAMLPQRLGLVDELSVRANVEFPARLAGRLGELRDRVDQLLEDLGLTAFQDRYPRETSVGEQQRTALARALVLSPRLVLADEPTGHQDEGWSTAVFDALRRSAADGTACVVATHDPAVTRLCDRVVAMADGKVLDGTAGASPSTSPSVWSRRT